MRPAGQHITGEQTGHSVISMSLGHARHRACWCPATTAGRSPHRPRRRPSPGAPVAPWALTVACRHAALPRVAGLVRSVGTLIELAGLATAGIIARSRPRIRSTGRQQWEGRAGVYQSCPAHVSPLTSRSGLPQGGPGRRAKDAATVGTGLAQPREERAADCENAEQCCRIRCTAHEAVASIWYSLPRPGRARRRRRRRPMPA
jgi:hypothetical protein